MSIPRLHSFQGKNQWPQVTIFWWTHGNEISGILATKTLVKNLAWWALKIQSWQLTIVTTVNEEAVKRNVRWVKDKFWKVLDMNRFFQDVPPMNTGYEFLRSRELMPVIEKSHFLLDLHSTSGPSQPFFFAEWPSAEFTLGLWGGDIVSGWSNIRSWNGEKMDYSPLAWDIESYATQHGAIGMTFEAGNHSAPDGSTNAYQVALNFLVKTWVIVNDHYRWLIPTPRHIQMDKTYIWNSDTFTYWFPITSNFTPLTSWQLIGHDDGIPIIAPYDCILVMPWLDPDSNIQANNRKWKNIFQIWTYIS